MTNRRVTTSADPLAPSVMGFCLFFKPFLKIINQLFRGQLHEGGFIHAQYFSQPLGILEPGLQHNPCHLIKLNPFRIRQIGSLDDVRRWGVREHPYRLDVARWDDTLRGPFRVVSREPTESGERVVVSLEDGARVDDLLKPVLEAGIAIDACDRVESDLEEAFARVIEAEDGSPE